MVELNLARVFGNLLLNDSVLQSPTAFFNVPDTVTTTTFPTLQTVVGTLVMLQSTKDGDTECYKMRSTPHTPSIWRPACILLSALIVIKPALPVALSVTWMPNWLSAVQINFTSHGLMYFSWDTECYTGYEQKHLK